MCVVYGSSPHLSSTTYTYPGVAEEDLRSLSIEALNWLSLLFGAILTRTEPYCIIHYQPGRYRWYSILSFIAAYVKEHLKIPITRRSSLVSSLSVIGALFLSSTPADSQTCSRCNDSPPHRDCPRTCRGKERINAGKRSVQPTHFLSVPIHTPPTSSET